MLLACRMQRLYCHLYDSIATCQAVFDGDLESFKLKHHGRNTVPFLVIQSSCLDGSAAKLHSGPKVRRKLEEI